MPKAVELTIEIEVQKVSCPGVWLCQDGRVSLTVFALGTSYQTCLLPPVFPLAFRDVFYFRKRFQRGCSLNNVWCLLNEETIYCELVQWSYDCLSGDCTMLAQYLGALNDVLFPPNVCSSDGVDLLMRRTKDFPGILSPKIEIWTKIRVDEIRNLECCFKSAKPGSCSCNTGQDQISMKQRPVCHSAQYHRRKCHKPRGSSRSRSRSKSSCSLIARTETCQCQCPNPLNPRPKLSFRSSARPQCDYSVYSVDTSGSSWRNATERSTENQDRDVDVENETSVVQPNEVRLQKRLVESRYIDEDDASEDVRTRTRHDAKVAPCVCEICKKYHEMFHINKKFS